MEYTQQSRRCIIATHNDLTVRTATREKQKCRMGLSGPPGSGKSFSALLVAYGLCGNWTKIGIIDAEERRGELYVNATVHGVQIGEYKVVTLHKPFTPERYIYAHDLLVKAGCEVVVFDGVTQAWDGTGGMLDQKDIIAKRGGNSYFAWRDITPQHNDLMECFLRSPAHIVVTCRSKVEYATEVNTAGKVVPVKLGMKPIYREGLEYEFLFWLEMTQDHTGIVTKEMMGAFDIGTNVKPTIDFGRQLLTWLDTGQEPKRYGWQDVWAYIATVPLFVLDGQFTPTWGRLLTDNHISPDMQNWTTREAENAKAVIDWFISQQK